jgi:hypothetical protein
VFLEGPGISATPYPNVFHLVTLFGISLLFSAGWLPSIIIPIHSVCNRHPCFGYRVKKLISIPYLSYIHVVYILNSNVRVTQQKRGCLNLNSTNNDQYPG